MGNLSLKEEKKKVKRKGKERTSSNMIGPESLWRLERGGRNRNRKEKGRLLS